MTRTDWRIWRRAISMARWLAEPWKLWITLLVLPASLFLGKWAAAGSSSLDPGDLAVRTAGYALTLLGAILVLSGAIELAALFDEASPLRRFWMWLKRLPQAWTARRNVFAHTGTGGVRIRGFDVDAVVTSTSESWPRRLSVLEKAVEDLRGQIRTNRREAERRATEIEAAVEAERNERLAGHAALTHALKRATVGGVDAQIMGVVWLVVGETFKTFPGEIAGLFF